MVKVLLVSDDAALIEQVQQLEDYAVYVAHDAPTLDDYLMEVDYFRLLLLDLSVALPDLPVVFEALCASGVNTAVIARREEEALPYLERGAVDYIILPMAVPLLRARLSAALRLKPEACLNMVRFMVHELKNPLMSVKGYSSAMASGMVGALNGEQAEFTEIILSNAERLDHLMNDLRDMALIDSGALHLQLSITSVSEVIHTVLVASEAVMLARGQALRLELPQDLPFVMSHGGYLARVLQILMDNALLYTPAGGEICLGVAQNGARLEICIQDSGYGIPLEEQPKVLHSRHFRSHDRRVRDLPGNGISLYIARHLVDALGGRLWFESTPDVGTTFYLTLPLYLA